MSGKGSGAPKRNTTNAADKDLTLSAALLSPINSLFETQIHSARAFLNFVLQMGFIDKPSITDLENDIAKLTDLIDRKVDETGKSASESDLNDMAWKKQRAELMKDYIDYQTLLKREKGGEELDFDDSVKLDNLKGRESEFNAANLSEDVYNLKFQYKDGMGNEKEISIPALALVPVQPLGISKATFDFNMGVSNHRKDFNQQQSSRSGAKKRPWFFINPKRIEGKIQSQNDIQTQRGIKIHVEIDTTPIPQGLSNLLTSLTQSGRVEDK